MQQALWGVRSENPLDASEHKHDDDEDIEDSRTRGASITIDLGYESDDGKRQLARGAVMSRSWHWHAMKPEVKVRVDAIFVVHSVSSHYAA